MKIGIVCVGELSADAQRMPALQRQGCDRILVLRGSSNDRNIIEVVRRRLVPGDTLVAANFASVATSMTAFVSLALTLSDREVHFISLQEGFDNHDPLWSREIKALFLELQDLETRPNGPQRKCLFSDSM
jgi:DNA invertase Pin-like site-specific DNA recombinase